jgi:hypothetical protein
VTVSGSRNGSPQRNPGDAAVAPGSIHDRNWLPWPLDNESGAADPNGEGMEALSVGAVAKPSKIMRMVSQEQIASLGMDAEAKSAQVLRIVEEDKPWQAAIASAASQQM